MNALTPFPTSTLPREPFERAISEVNAWRGRCLDTFTRAEAAVTECLLALSVMPGRSSDIALPHLLGERFDALASAVSANGPFALKCTHTTPALSRFRKHAPLRNMLCHAVANVTLDQKGQWTLIFRLAALRSGRVVREVLVIREDEAGPLAAQVANEYRNLRSRLEKFVSNQSATLVTGA